MTSNQSLLDNLLAIHRINNTLEQRVLEVAINQLEIFQEVLTKLKLNEHATLAGYFLNEDNIVELLVDGDGAYLAIHHIDPVTGHDNMTGTLRLSEKFLSGDLDGYRQELEDRYSNLARQFHQSRLQHRDQRIRELTEELGKWQNLR